VTRVQIAVAESPDSDWDGFVAAIPDASGYLRAGWSLLARDAFRHRAYFLHARSPSGALRGVLPLVQQRGLLGNFATSVPFFNYGGAVADDDDCAVALMERARELARSLGCSYLELRDVRARPIFWPVRTDKASMLLDLPEDIELLGKQLGSKLRSQIKRANREQVSVRSGGIELLGAFYDVFARNMRDLGTPVYPVRFFRAVLERFPVETQIVVIEQGDRPQAAGFLVFDRLTAEIPWAACRAEAKPLGMNMKLYWELLCASIARGARHFDFGRSTIGSGTYRFKQQWGALPRQLHWYRWERAPASGGAGAGKPGRLTSLALRAWKRLPLPLANALGPLVSPGLPW
jgi:FemAB-related protein (PEP-CTERM system-associated)